MKEQSENKTFIPVDIDGDDIPDGYLRPEKVAMIMQHVRSIKNTVNELAAKKKRNTKQTIDINMPQTITVTIKDPDREYIEFSSTKTVNKKETIKEAYNKLLIEMLETIELTK